MKASRGFVMIAVLVALLVIAAIGVLLMTESGGEADRAARGTEALQAQYLAQAALDHAIWSADHKSCGAYGVPTTTFGAHTYSAAFSPANGSPTTVTATAVLASGVARTASRAAVPIYAPTATQLVSQPDAAHGKDVWYEAGQSSRNYGAHRDLPAADAAGQRSLLGFDLLVIPPGARVVSATLELWANTVQTSGNVSLYRVTRDWVEGTCQGSGCTADGATWASTNGSAPWQTPGGDADATALASRTVSTANAWHSFDVTSMVAGWVSGGVPNHGVLIRGAGSANVKFDGSDAATAAQHPKLTVSYQCECGVACTAAQSSGNVLLVVANPASLLAVEAYKKNLMESWGYTVAPLDDGSLQAAYNTAIAANDVVYVAASVDSAAVGTKLTTAAIGVINEEGALDDELGFSTTQVNPVPVGDSINVTNNSHYITQPFPAGPLKIYAADMGGHAASGTLAAGLQGLANWGSSPGLAVIDAGAALGGGAAGTNAPARRVLVPFGQDDNHDWSKLNNNGRLILQRALDWGGNVGGPTAHWKLDDAAGTTAIDSEGGHHGTLVGGPVWTTGARSGALDFDGVDDYVNLTSDAALDNIFAAGATVAAWINPATFGENNYGRVIDKDNNVTLPGSGWALEFNGPGARLLLQRGFSTAGGEWATPIGSIALNAWQHVAVVYDGASAANNPIIYLNGVAQAITKTRTPSGTPTSDAAITLRLGNYAGDTSRTFDGRIDDVRIYRTALTAADVAELAAPSGPIAHWKLDEISGSIAVDSVGGNDGTVMNGAVWVTGKVDGGLSFDGNNDYIDVSSLNPRTYDDLTISAWYKSAQSSVSDDEYIFEHIDYLVDEISFAATDDGGERLRFGFTVSGTWSPHYGTSDIVDQQWHHLVAVRSSGRVRLYVDNVKETDQPDNFAGVSVAVDADGPFIGDYPGRTEQVHGIVDDVRLYDRGLSDAEVAELFALGGGGGGGSYSVLMAVPDPSNLSVAGAARKALVESWGHTVTLIDDSATQANFDAAIAANDVAYISSEVVTSTLGNKLTAATFGVVNENRTTAANLGLVGDSFDAVTGSSLVIEDNTHFITEEFSLGQLTILTASAVLLAKDDTLAPDIVGLGSRTGAPSFLELAVLDQGGTLWNGSAAAGRRVQLPWGDGAFNPNALTADGRKILQRAIEWGAGAGAGFGFGGGGGGCNATFADDFASGAYTGSTGTGSWATSWLEINESDGATGGDEQVVSGRARVQDNDSGGEGLQREANLTGYTSATLSLTYQRTALDDANDYATAEISSNGGGSWTELARLAGPTNDASPQPATYNITSHISANTRIRMLTSSAMGGSDLVYFDDVVIAASGCP